MLSTWICIADIFHILAKFKMEKFMTKSCSWLICRSCSFLDHWLPVLIPQHTAPQPLLDASVWIRTCLCLWFYTQLVVCKVPDYLPIKVAHFLSWESALPKLGKTVFVLEIQFAVVARNQTVDGLWALLEWLKKVFLLVLSNTQALILYLSYLFL